MKPETDLVLRPGRSQPAARRGPCAAFRYKKQHFPPGIHGLSAEIPQVRFQPLARAVSQEVLERQIGCLSRQIEDGSADRAAWVAQAPMRPATCSVL
jgi:hypothetical protein